MTNDEAPQGSPRLEWLVYASPTQVRDQVQAACSDVGLFCAIRPDFHTTVTTTGFATTVALARQQPVPQPPPPVPLGTFSGEVEWFIREPKHPADGQIIQIAGVSIGSLPGERSDLKLWHHYLPLEEEANIGELGVSSEQLDRQWNNILDRLPRRFQLTGLDFDDILAPGFKQAVSRERTPAAISKPSERSMWVDPVFYGREFRRQDDLCFVIMPYDPQTVPVYKSALKPVIEELGLKCLLASDITGGHTEIVEDIWIALNEARFVIADLSGQNPNVYYELGIANTLGKRNFAVQRSEPGVEARLPFDVRARRTIFYEDTIAGSEAFRQQLRAHVETILHSSA